jgi:hypothetical protein
MSDHDQQVEKIRAYNQPILDEFQAWLEKARLVPKTVMKHVDNIDFFTEYLVSYEPLSKLDEADEIDIMSFFGGLVSSKSDVGFCSERAGLYGLLSKILQVSSRKRADKSRNGGRGQSDAQRRPRRVFGRSGV